MTYRVAVQGPKGLSIEEQESLLRVCAQDLVDLGIPSDRLILTSDDLEVEVDL